MATQKTKVEITTEDLLSIPQAAKELGVHFTTVYRWIHKGRLYPFRIGNQVYITSKEVEELKNA